MADKNVTHVQKHSGVQNRVPTTGDLVLGELAVNSYDGKLFLKKDNGSESIIALGEDKVEWKGEWVETTYNKNDMVKDGEWTMIAVAETTDRAAPQPVGNPKWGIDPTEDFNSAQYTGIVTVRQSYIVNTGGWIQLLQVRMPNWTIDTTTVKITVEIGSQVTVISNPILSNDDIWVNVSIGEHVVSSGTTISVVMDMYHQNDAGRISGGWNSNIGTGVPASQGFNISSADAAGTMTIDHTDLAGNLRETELRGVQVGSIITLTETGDSARSSTFEATSVDSTNTLAYSTYAYDYIDQGTRGPVRGGRTVAVSIDVPITVATDYSVIPDWYIANPADWAEINTSIAFDGITSGFNTNAYGINLLFQPGLISEDWDLVATSAIGGGSGSGGGGVVGEAPADGLPYSRQDTLWTEAPTLAQGILADSALQPGDNNSELVNDAGYITLAEVPADAVTSVDGRTGVVTLTDIYAPIVHTHVKTDITDFDEADYATAAQGALADSALQSGDNVSELANDAGYITLAEVPPGGVTSVFSRQGDVVAVTGDYAASNITNDSTVIGATVMEALDTLESGKLEAGDNVSDLVNDAGYLVPGDNNSLLVNDAGYITLAEVPEQSYQFSEANPTGLADGGELNIIGADIQIISGFGVIVDSYTDPLSPPVITNVSWDTIQQPIATAAVPGAYAFFTINAAGALTEYNTIPTQEIRRDEIMVGLAIYDGTNWGEVSSPTVVNNAAHTVEDFLNTVIGPTTTISGGAVTEAASYTLDREAGVVWEMNRNWHVNKKDPHREAFDAFPNLQWRYINNDFTNVSALTGTVIPDQYDDGTNIVAVPGNGNRCTIQRLYVDPRDNYWMLWGQVLHDNFNDASSRIGVDTATTTIPLLLENGSQLLGYVIVENGQTDWAEEDARFVSTAIAGGGGSGGATALLQLSDFLPVGYTGEAGKALVVDAGEAGVSFTDLDTIYLQPGDNVSELNNDAGYLPTINNELLEDLSNVDTTGVLDGQALIYSNTTTEWIPGDNAAGVKETAIKVVYYADMFVIPNNSDWPITTFAGIEPHGLYPSMLVRTFTEGGNSGVGFSIAVPSGAQNVEITTISISDTGGEPVACRLHSRQVPNGSEVADWNDSIDSLIIPATSSDSFTYSSDSYVLADLEISAGLTYWFEFSRIPGNDTHVGDWSLLELGMVFT